MTKRYILFDLDGTITDSSEGITKSVQHALKKPVSYTHLTLPTTSRV